MPNLTDLFIVFKGYILLIIFMLLGTICCLGQTIKLTGKVVDEKTGTWQRKAVIAATINPHFAVINTI